MIVVICEEPRSGEEAIQESALAALDCFVASLLAMTVDYSAARRAATI
jgi:hypothetical protein